LLFFVNTVLTVEQKKTVGISEKIFVRLLNVRVVGGLWVRLGKFKCAAKVLACVSACSSFNFAKRGLFFCQLMVFVSVG
jgi:hypothetical protein